MSGYMIESKQMNEEMAGEIVRLLGNVTINGSSAPNYLSLVISLQRIAEGTDRVVESTTE